MVSQAFTKVKWSVFIRVPVECYIQITAVTTYYKNVIYFKKAEKSLLSFVQPIKCAMNILSLHITALYRMIRNKRFG